MSTCSKRLMLGFFWLALPLLEGSPLTLSSGLNLSRARAFIGIRRYGTGSLSAEANRKADKTFGTV